MRLNRLFLALALTTAMGSAMAATPPTTPALPLTTVGLANVEIGAQAITPPNTSSSLTFGTSVPVATAPTAEGSISMALGDSTAHSMGMASDEALRRTTSVAPSGANVGQTVSISTPGEPGGITISSDAQPEAKAPTFTTGQDVMAKCLFQGGLPTEEEARQMTSYETTLSRGKDVLVRNTQTVPLSQPAPVSIQHVVPYTEGMDGGRKITSTYNEGYAITVQPVTLDAERGTVLVRFAVDLAEAKTPTQFQGLELPDVQHVSNCGSISLKKGQDYTVDMGDYRFKLVRKS